MNPEKVLIITYYWPPSGGAGVQRFLKFVKYLPEYGLQPVVLTCSNPSYPLLDPSLSDDIPPDTAVHKARTIEPFSIYSKVSGKPISDIANPSMQLGSGHPGLSKRLAHWIRANCFIPDARAGWVPFARKKALHLVKTQDIKTVVTTGPPHSTHFIGSYLKKKAKIRWIADFRDPWTDIHYNRVLPRTGLTRFIDKKMETSVLSAANEITVTAPGTARYFSKKVNRSFHVIPNGFDPDDFQHEKDSPNLSENDAFVIRHTGSIMETSLPTNLLDVLSAPKYNQCRLEFVGGAHPVIKEKANQKEWMDKIRFVPYLPHKEATQKMQTADVNLVVVHRSADSRILIPGKVFDYLKAGKPILVIGPTDGDTASIVRQCQAGKTFDYNDENGLSSWIDELILAKKESRPFLPDDAAIAVYARPALAQRLAGIILDKLDTNKAADVS